MKVRYIGPDGGVQLAPAYGDFYFPRGTAIEVPEQLGRQLVEQAIFVAETPERKKRRPNPTSDPNVEARHDGNGTEAR